MLEVKNIVKKYEMKGGATVKALNNVSIKFPDRGMVFVLGKSGSGKSTLLNVMGGLDAPDSGEIIIKDKSSRNFEQKDFDSYRNTYVGFIFQEYNLLEDFNVEENISLALELQKKDANPTILMNILNQVGLRGLGKRKVTELSGGQKQRVAIARALVKNPEIIFADEPSGALDSTTGKQIFDTLKELSKEKLIVIISHDRDFAEMYADRIIELKDGQVYSDVTKLTGDKKYSGMIELGNGLIKIPKGKKITSSELSRINSILERVDQDVYITANPIFNTVIGEVVGDDTNAVQFVKTNENDIKDEFYRRESSFEQINSHLSWRKCAKMSFAILKHKPVRLFITTLLCVISFTMFGLTTVFATYSKTGATARTIAKQELEYLPITKVANLSTDSELTNNQIITINDDDINNIKEILAKGVKKGEEIETIPIFSTERYASSYISVPIENSINTTYYTGGIKGLCDYRYVYDDYSLIAGEWPIRSDGNDSESFGEIVITKNFYDTIKENGQVFIETFIQNGETVEEREEINVPADLIGNYLHKGSYDFKIVGVVDTVFDKTRYEVFKDRDSLSEEDLRKYSELTSQFVQENNYSIHSLGFVTKATLNTLIEDNAREIIDGTTTAFVFHDDYYVQGDTFAYSVVDRISNMDNDILNSVVDNPYQDTSYRDTEVSNECYLNSLVYFSHIETGGYKAKAFNNESNIKVTLPDGFQEEGEDQIVESFPLRGISSQIKQTVAKIVSKKFTNLENSPTLINDYVDPFLIEVENGTEIYANPSETVDVAVEGTSDSSETGTNVLNLNLKEVQNACVETYDDILNQIAEQIFTQKCNCLFMKYESSTLNENDIKGTEKYGRNDYMPGVPALIKGISRKIDKDVIYTDEKLYNEYASKAVSKPYSFLLYKNTSNETNILSNIISQNFIIPAYRTSNYILQNYLFESFEIIDSFVSSLSNIFLIAGGVATLFAIILFSNFITSSINDKQAEIGILRALGSKGMDIFKLFYVESLLISTICTVLSIVFTSGSLIAINRAFSSVANVSMTVFYITPLLIGVIVGLSVIVAFVSSFIPVNKISKKKPVDAIRKSV